MPVELQHDSRGRAAGRLIELTQETARISQLGNESYQPGDPVVLRTACGRKMQAHVRWAHSGLAGLRFDTALHLPELSEWVSAQRAESAYA